MLINWYSTAGQGGGYSGAAENMITELEEAGVDVRLITHRKIIQENLTKEGKKMIGKPFQMGKVGIFFGFPNGFNSILNEVKIGFTMFETDRLPNGTGARGEQNDWSGLTGESKDMINPLLNELWVPCRHNADLFEQSGVTVPVRTISLGVNRRLYYDMSEHRAKTRKDRPFTFLMFGTLTSRKNVGASIIAFMNAFGANPDVKLILKSSSGTLAAMKFPEGVNIEIIDEYSSIEKVQQYYAEADAFVFPSRGEGFGLPPLEAMATGLPTIFADNTGMSDYADTKYNYPVISDKKAKADRFPARWGDVGNWYEVDLMDLQVKMRYVYENQDEAIKKGKEAAKHVAENWTYRNTAESIIKQLEKFL